MILLSPFGIGCAPAGTITMPEPEFVQRLRFGEMYECATSQYENGLAEHGYCRGKVFEEGHSRYALIVDGDAFNLSWQGFVGLSAEQPDPPGPTPDNFSTAVRRETGREIIRSEVMYGVHGPMGLKGVLADEIRK